MHRKPLKIRQRRGERGRLPSRLKSSLKAVDFFCGAGGMSYGLARAGIKVLAGIDFDDSCRETYDRNNKPARFLHKDIAVLSTTSLAKEIKISRHDNQLIFAACSPCQFWSKVNTDRKKNRTSAFLLHEFERFVDWFKPGFVVIENVPGLLSKKRVSLLPRFKKFLKARNYFFDHGVINSNHYGVPQNRRRYLLVATRLTKEVRLPSPIAKRPIVRDFIGEENGFPAIQAGHKDESHFMHTAARLSSDNLKRIQRTPPNGGTRENWKNNSKLQIPAYQDNDDIFRDVYSRMYWDRPAPTITTRFNSFSNGRFGHPSENRAISLREGATLQTFPKRYVFEAASQATIARQIGNAVPPLLARKIGKLLTNLAKNG